MEENVALDSSKQKKFDKSIKGIKKLIKKKDGVAKPTEETGEKVKTGRVAKIKRKERGLVYLSHIPHGFYENEMTQYFKQFGMVTNARVIKSQRTGRSKGFAFVEFKEPAVAQIVAETMNNYLMGKRLIKAAYIPPEKQKPKAFRRNWNAVYNPGNNLRIKMKKKHNENKTEEDELKTSRKLLSNINKTKGKLSELGINYDFFTPVDVPEALVPKVQVKADTEGSKENIAGNAGEKFKKKGKKGDIEKVEVKKETSLAVKAKTKNTETVKETKQKQNKLQIKTSTSDQVKVDQKTQNQKKKQLQKQGVTSLEDFMKIQQDSENSDSSVGFDSDDFEKMIKNEVESDVSEDDDVSDEGDDSNEDEDSKMSQSGSDESEEELPKKNNGNKPMPYVTPTTKMQPKKIIKQETLKKAGQLQNREAKRKAAPPAPQKTTSTAPKKPKFEKQNNQKARNKQFKKKNK